MSYILLPFVISPLSYGATRLDPKLRTQLETIAEINKKYDTYYKIDEEMLKSVKTTNKQDDIINYVRNKGLVRRSELLGISVSIISNLVKKGVLVSEKQECYRLGALGLRC